MKALIIAAGRGNRFNHLTNDRPKPLVRLLGLSLIERVILTAKQAGIDDFVIVNGYLGEKIKETLGEGEKYKVRITYVENTEWQRANGISVLEAKELLKERFVLLMADHVFDDRILKELIDYDTESSVVLAIDRRKPLTGDTRVLEKERRIVDIGKDIEESNCIDTGIFLCSTKLFQYVEEAVREGKTEFAKGIAIAARKGDAEIFDISMIESYASKMRKEIKPWWIDIDTEEDLIKAKAIIMENA
jgi:CDP-L-myo-inositol myo-inositolphosphotransferase